MCQSGIGNDINDRLTTAHPTIKTINNSNIVYRILQILTKLTRGPMADDLRIVNAQYPCLLSWDYTYCLPLYGVPKFICALSATWGVN
jgi:hypothetical protein